MRRDDGSAARLGYSRFSLALLFFSLSFFLLSSLRTFFACFSILSSSFYISNFIFPGFILFYFLFCLKLYYSARRPCESRISVFRSCLFYALAIVYIPLSFTVLEEFHLKIVSGFFLPLFSFRSSPRCQTQIETQCKSAMRCNLSRRKKLSTVTYNAFEAKEFD